MPKRLTAAVAALAAYGIATATTRAQEPSPTTLTATVRATPGKAGTARRPVGVKVQGRIDLTTPEGVARPTVTAFELWTGPGVVFNRKGVPACSIATLRQRGPSGCPPKSLMGSSSTGGVNPPDLRQDLRPTFINAPGGRLAAWFVLYNPARAQAATVSTVVDGATGPWPHRERWAIPRAVQVVAGIPTSFDSLSFAIGGKTWAKNYIATTSCPQGGWRWKVRVHTLTEGTAAVLEKHGQAPCHR